LHQSATDVSDSPVTDARTMDLRLQLAVSPVCLSLLWLGRGLSS